MVLNKSIQFNLKINSVPLLKANCVIILLLTILLCSMLLSGCQGEATLRDYTIGFYELVSRGSSIAVDKIELVKDIKRNPEVIKILSKIGEFYFNKGDFEDALNFYNSIKIIGTETEDPEILKMSLIKLKEILLVTYRLNDVVETLRELLNYYKAKKNIIGFADTKIEVAKFYMEIKEYTKALIHLKEAKELYARIHTPEGRIGIINAHNLSGLCNIRLGLFDDAIQDLDNAREYATTFGDKRLYAITMNNYALLYIIRKAYDKVLEPLARAEKIFKEQKENRELSSCYKNYGVFYRERNEWKKSLQYFVKGIELLDDPEYHSERAEIFSEMGLLAFYQDDFTKAIENYDRAIKERIQINDKINAAVGYYNLAVCNEKINNINSAIEFLKKCLEIEKGLLLQGWEDDEKYLYKLENIRKTQEASSKSESNYSVQTIPQKDASINENKSVSIIDSTATIEASSVNTSTNTNKISNSTDATSVTSSTSVTTSKSSTDATHN